MDVLKASTQCDPKITRKISYQKEGNEEMPEMMNIAEKAFGTETVYIINALRDLEEASVRRRQTGLYNKDLNEIPELKKTLVYLKCLMCLSKILIRF